MNTSCSCGSECSLCENCGEPKCECFCDLYDEEEEKDYSKDYYM